MGEKVVIEFDAKTQAVISAIERVEGRITALGNTHKTHADRMAGGWRRVKDAVVLANQGLDLMGRVTGIITRPMGQLIRMSLQWEQSMRAVGLSLGGVMDNALEGAGVVGGFQGAVDSLVTSINDASSPIGSFVREGLGGIVTFGTGAIGVLLEMSVTVLRVTDAIRGAYQELMDASERGSNYAAEQMTGFTDMLGITNVGTRTPLSQLTGGMAPASETTNRMAEAQADLAAWRTRVDEMQRSLGEFNTGVQSGLQGDSTPSTPRGTGGGRGGGGTRHTFTWVGMLAASLHMDSNALEVELTNTRKVLEEIERLRSEAEEKGLIEAAGAKIAGQGWTTGADSRVRLAEGLGELGRLGGAGAAEGIAAEGALHAAMSGAFAQLPGDVSNALGQVGSSIGAFISGTEGAFASLGDALKSTLAGSLGGIGNALMQGAIAAGVAGTATLGPIGILIGLGMALMTASGLLGGTGGGSTANPAKARAQADVFSAIRSESGGGGSTIVYHTSIGSMYADPSKDDTASRMVAGGLRRLRRTGEMPR